MAYLTEADYRAESLAEYCSGLTLTIAEAPAALLTAAIASASVDFDAETSDHYEPQTPVTLTLDVDHWSRRLYLPRRVQTVTAVRTVDEDGVETLETATTYRVHSSLTEAPRTSMDWIEVIRGETLSTGSPYWPKGIGTVEVDGTFGWAACPAPVKRAVALIVYDRIKPQADALRVAESWQTQDAAFRRSSGPFGIPEADRIAERFSRKTPV